MGTLKALNPSDNATDSSVCTVVWASAVSSGVPTFKEKTFIGTVAAAIDYLATTLSTELDFLMGQVLEADGRILATVGPAGAIRRSSIPE